MKVLYYDCFSGISGDMNLGALLDLGVAPDYLIKELMKLKIHHEFTLKIEKQLKKGISGTKVDVLLQCDQEHSHSDEQGHEHSHSHEHHHRNLQDVEDIIHSSELSQNVKELSSKIFLEIAQAESKIHGKTINEIHFHEVGAIDSIVDIIGAAICLDYLNVDRIICSSVQVGGGFVNCAHGKIPVPAPATAEILRNVPLKSGLVNFETTTPTGAAILKATCDEFTDKQNFIIEKIGYGIGNRDLEIPNVLRVYIGNTPAESDFIKAEQIMIETNIDDMNPEKLDYVEKLLFSKKALDVYKTPVIMKKGRLSTKLSVLLESKSEDEILDILFRETTTIGIRKYHVEKIMLKREFIKVTTSCGEISVKKAYYQGKLLKYKAEYAECEKAALKNNVSINQILQEIDKIMGALHQ